jgi:hypothetical protein
MTRFMEILKNVGETALALAPGLRNAPSEIGAEVKRLGVQGQMESASLIFQGHAFVPYGPGQNRTEAEKAIESPSIEPPSMEPPEHSQSRSM